MFRDGFRGGGEDDLLGDLAQLVDDLVELALVLDGLAHERRLGGGKAAAHGLGAHLARPAPGVGGLGHHAALAQRVEASHARGQGPVAAPELADLLGGERFFLHRFHFSVDVKAGVCVYIRIDMRNPTPFFPAFGPLLFGRAPRSALSTLLAKLRRGSSLGEMLGLLGELVPQTLLGPMPEGDHSRNRQYPLSLTFWAFLAQVLSPGCACREIVRRVQAWYASAGSAIGLSPASAAYCTARAKLALDTLGLIFRHLAERLEGGARNEDLWLGRRVRIMDGTTVSMPDTPANQRAYPQPSSQKPGCGFPVMKLVGLFSLASGALLGLARTTLRVHESRVAPALWDLLQAGDILLADRGFCSYFALCQMARRGVAALMRVHHARGIDWRAGRRLGSSDRIQIWRKPLQRPPGISPEEFDALPPQIEVRLLRVDVSARGFRTLSLTLVTTLLDAAEFPFEALAALYMERWGVELHFRQIKIMLGMDVLRCLSPHMIEREVSMHMIAYNMVRALMQQAALRHRVDLSRLSFKGSLDTLRHFAPQIDAARRDRSARARLIDEMLRLIAEDIVPFRPNRSEPRAKKRRPKNYQLLTRPRHQMGHLPHRNRPRARRPTRLSSDLLTYRSCDLSAF